MPRSRTSDGDVKDETYTSCIRRLERILKKINCGDEEQLKKHVLDIHKQINFAIKQLQLNDLEKYSSYLQTLAKTDLPHQYKILCVRGSMRANAQIQNIKFLTEYDDVQNPAAIIRQLCGDVDGEDAANLECLFADEVEAGEADEVEAGEADEVEAGEADEA